MVGGPLALLLLSFLQEKRMSTAPAIRNSNKLFRLPGI
jgi:hypothetical protein